MRQKVKVILYCTWGLGKRPESRVGRASSATGSLAMTMTVKCNSEKKEQISVVITDCLKVHSAASELHHVWVILLAGQRQAPGKRASGAQQCGFQGGVARELPAFPAGLPLRRQTRSRPSIRTRPGRAHRLRPSRGSAAPPPRQQVRTPSASTLWGAGQHSRCYPRDPQAGRLRTPESTRGRADPAGTRTATASSPTHRAPSRGHWRVRMRTMPAPRPVVVAMVTGAPAAPPPAPPPGGSGRDPARGEG